MATRWSRISWAASRANTVPLLACSDPEARGNQVGVRDSCVTLADYTDIELLRAQLHATGSMLRRSTKISARNVFLQNYARPAGAVIVYYFIGYLFYGLHRGWSFIDCAYFSTVLMTTVGYGDQVPHGDLGLLFTAAYAMMAFALVATAVSKLLDWTVLRRVMEYQQRKCNGVRKDLDDLHSKNKKKQLEDQFKAKMKKLRSTVRRNFFDSQAELLDEQAQARRQRKMLFLSIGLYCAWLVLGTIVNARWHDLSDEDWEGSRFVKGFYFSVVTLTTVGFGDFAPTTSAGKAFDIFYILTGVPICVNALSQLVEVIWGATEEAQKIDLVHGLTEQKLQTMLDFQREMAKAGCANIVDDKISEYEFLLFMLIKNGIVEMDMVSQIMHNFRALDDTSNGFLDMRDVMESSSHSQPDDPSVPAASPRCSHGGA